ncbi:MAG: hypothetical protein AB1714_17455 [Acidobacteriota bacterium]
MAICENDYRRNEDESQWEIHEIRRALSEDFEGKTVDQINREAMQKYLAWKERSVIAKPEGG